MQNTYHVYLLRSVKYQDQIYVGYSLNVQERLKTHNAGGSIHTASGKPWELVMFLTFHNEKTAREFEYYLKTQSGRAFLHKRFL
jgi:putative endonuclease